MGHAAIAGRRERGIVGGLGFGGRDIADGLKEPVGIEPVAPFERGMLERLVGSPGAAPWPTSAADRAAQASGKSGVVQTAKDLGSSHARILIFRMYQNRNGRQILG